MNRCGQAPGDYVGVSPEAIAGTTMKAVQMYSPFGDRGKIGLILPSTNTVAEPEFNQLAPKGVSIHVSRIMMLGKATEESYRRIGDETARAADELATAEVDIVAWGCTSGSVVLPRNEIELEISKRTKVPAVTSMTAVIEALAALGAKSISLGTPYVKFVNEGEVRLLQQEGIKVCASYGLGLGETQEERRGIGRVPPETIFRLARYVDHPEADAVFLSCTNLATIDVVEAVEKELGKPVITSNLAVFWRVLRQIGFRDSIPYRGTLLRDH
jgi:arylmalonate decarboxylase